MVEGPTMLSSEVDLNPELDDIELDDRELEVLKLLSSDLNAYFSFQGLRRRLGFHQETLTRTLKRLEEANVIERTPAGYKAKNPHVSFGFTVNGAQALPKPIVEAYLPAQVDVTVLFQRLRGRWFSNSRWLGYSQDGERFSMRWISEDGQLQIQARIGQGKITIATTSPAGKPEADSVAAAYQLFEHISKIAEEMVQHQGPVAS